MKKKIRKKMVLRLRHGCSPTRNQIIEMEEASGLIEESKRDRII